MRMTSVLLRIAILVAPIVWTLSAQAEDPEPPPKPRDLGPPLVDNINDLKQLGKFAAWLDPKNKQVVLVGETCKSNYGLEFLITTHERAYESVIVIDGRHPADGGMSLFKRVQLALILLGAKPGHPAYYRDERTTLATGDEIAIELRWKDKEGKVQKADARKWIRDVKTKKSPDKNWVFAGSRFVDDGEGGKRFMADGGDFVCVLNSPVAMLDLPILSASAIEERLFETNSDAVPPPETPVTIVLRPVAPPKAETAPKPDAGKP